MVFERRRTDRNQHRAKSLLEICREIERALGRDPENRKGPRTLDLDLLLYDDCVISTTLP